MSDGLIGKSDEASKGAFQGILKVEGLFATADRIANPWNTEEGQYGMPKDQAQVVLEDAIILEMEEGESEPELKDSKFTIYMNYALPGKEKPHQNTFYVKGFVKSAEELWKARGEAEKTWTDLLNTRVTLERREIPLFSRPKEDNSDEKETFTGAGFVFVEGDVSDSKDIREHITGIVVGKNKSAALRAVLTDARAKQFPEYKEAIQSDTLGDLLDVELVDNKYVPKEA